jgi:hypothetical protein
MYVVLGGGEGKNLPWRGLSRLVLNHHELREDAEDGARCC